jgi:hypothetical protein
MTFLSMHYGIVTTFFMGPLTALNHWVDTTTEMVEYINGRLRG